MTLVATTRRATHKYCTLYIRVTDKDLKAHEDLFRRIINDAKERRDG